MTTYSHPGEWDSVIAARTAASQRSTTSSRHPGREFVGTVYHLAANLTECEGCGVLRRGTGPHAPRWRDGVLRDCQGRTVEVAR